MPISRPPYETGDVEKLRDDLRRGRLRVVFLDVGRVGSSGDAPWTTKVVVKAGSRFVGTICDEVLETRVDGEAAPEGPPVSPVLESNRDLPGLPLGAAIRGMAPGRLVFGLLPEGGNVLELELSGEAGCRTLVFSDIGELSVSGFPSCSCHATPVLLDIRSWGWDGFNVGVWAETCGWGGLRFFARGVKEGRAK